MLSKRTTITARCPKCRFAISTGLGDLIARSTQSIRCTSCLSDFPVLLRPGLPRDAGARNADTGVAANTAPCV